MSSSAVLGIGWRRESSWHSCRVWLSRSTYSIRTHRKHRGQSRFPKKIERGRGFCHLLGVPHGVFKVSGELFSFQLVGMLGGWTVLETDSTNLKFGLGLGYRRESRRGLGDFTQLTVKFWQRPPSVSLFRHLGDGRVAFVSSTGASPIIYSPFITICVAEASAKL